MPGRQLWPMVLTSFVAHQRGPNGEFGLVQQLPANYYVIGSCVLTSQCCKALDDLFKPMPWHACKWPGAAASRTCPFCACGLEPGKGEFFTLVCQQLVAMVETGIGSRILMQLVCAHCTRRMLRKVVPGSERDQTELMVGKTEFHVDCRPRLKQLCNSSTFGPRKAAALWNNAINTGLISSIQAHANNRTGAMFAAMSAQGNAESPESSIVQQQRGSQWSEVEGGGAGGYFEQWVSSPGGVDAEANLEADLATRQQTQSPSTAGVNGGGRGETGEKIFNQEFVIRQVEIIRDQQKRLRTFWQKCGGDLRRCWRSWAAKDQMKLLAMAGTAFVEQTNHQLANPRGNYHHVEDKKPLVHEPFGTVPRSQQCFLPEVAACMSGPEACGKFVELMRQRCTELCVEEDVVLCNTLKTQKRLPKLFLRRKQATGNDNNMRSNAYMCDYMIEEAGGKTGHIVFVGQREPQYDEYGGSRLSMTGSFTVEDIVSENSYSSLRTEPFKDKVTIISALKDSKMAADLRALVPEVATDAAAYIYAALRQTMLNEFLLLVAEQFC